MVCCCSLRVRGLLCDVICCSAFDVGCSLLLFDVSCALIIPRCSLFVACCVLAFV